MVFSDWTIGEEFDKGRTVPTVGRYYQVFARRSRGRPDSDQAS